MEIHTHFYMNIEKLTPNVCMKGCLASWERRITCLRYRRWSCGCLQHISCQVSLRLIIPDLRSFWDYFFFYLSNVLKFLVCTFFVLNASFFVGCLLSDITIYNIVSGLPQCPLPFIIKQFMSYAGLRQYNQMQVSSNYEIKILK